jgi:hypothetical protein
MELLTLRERLFTAVARYNAPAFLRSGSVPLRRARRSLLSRVLGYAGAVMTTALLLAACGGGSVATQSQRTGQLTVRHGRRSASPPPATRLRAGIAFLRVSHGGNAAAANVTAVLYLPTRQGLTRVLGPIRSGGCGDDLTLNAHWFAYCDWHYLIHLVNLKTRRQTVVWPYASQAPAFSEDRRYLAFETLTRPSLLPLRLRIYNLRNGSSQSIPFPRNGYEWSRGGSRLVWSVARQVSAGHPQSVVIAAAGHIAHARRVRIPGAGFYSEFSWGWNDAALLYSSTSRKHPRFHFLKFDLATRRSTTLAVGPECCGALPFAVAAGPHIVLSNYELGYELFSVVRDHRIQGVSLPGQRGAGGGCCNVSPTGMAALIGWTRYISSTNRLANGIALWRAGHAKAREVGPGVDAFWVRP